MRKVILSCRWNILNLYVVTWREFISSGFCATSRSLLSALIFTGRLNLQFSQFSPSVMSNSLPLQELQHKASLTITNSRSLLKLNSIERWCHPTISSSVVPFSSHLQSFPASGSFPMSQFFESGGQNIGISVSASVLPMNIQDWFPLGWTGWISLQSKGLSRVFSNTTVQKHQFFNAQLSFREGDGTPLQYFCLENPMEGGAW